MSSQLTTLVGVPSPRNITPVLECHDLLRKAHPEVPFLYVKYYPELYAYAIIRDYFLNRSKAEYLVLAPDDLTFRVQDFETLLKSVDEQRFPVFSAVCNLTMVAEQAELLNICIKDPVVIDRKTRKYNWPSVRDPKLPKGIIKVMFAGFPLMFIRRDIVQDIGFQGDLDDNALVRKKYRIPSSFDTVFCWRCYEHQIPIYVNIDVRLLHLKGADSRFKCAWQVERRLTGIEPPLTFCTKGDRSIDLTDAYRKWISKQKLHGDPAEWVARMSGKSYLN